MSNPKKEDDRNNSGVNWLEFSQCRPTASVHLHQAAALLHSMDEAFRCSICRNIFQNPVAVQPCHHSFCNDCVHKALRSDNPPGAGVVSPVLRCPCCQARIDDRIDLAKNIVQNRNFEEAARHYRTLRPLLERALQGQPASRGDPELTAHYAMASHAGFGNPSLADSDKGPGRGRKKGNPWIRDQFSVEFLVKKETWAFSCIHCGKCTMRSKNKVWNATYLTDHILQRCPNATEEMKHQAVELSQRSPPFTDSRAPASSPKKKDQPERKKRKRSEGTSSQSGDEQKQPKSADGDDDSYEPYLDKSRARRSEEKEQDK